MEGVLTRNDILLRRFGCDFVPLRRKSRSFTVVNSLDFPLRTSSRINLLRRIDFLKLAAALRDVEDVVPYAESGIGGRKPSKKG